MSAENSASLHVKEKYGSEVSYKVLIKPIASTGGNGIQFVDGVDEVTEHSYPCLIQERIVPKLHKGHVVDLRVFFVDGWVANPIARAAPHRFNDDKVNIERRLLTALCSGGRGIKVCEEISDVLKDYTLATSIALEGSLHDTD